MKILLLLAVLTIPCMAQEGGSARQDARAAERLRHAKWRSMPMAERIEVERCHVNPDDKCKTVVTNGVR